MGEFIGFLLGVALIAAASVGVCDWMDVNFEERAPSMTAAAIRTTVTECRLYELAVSFSADEQGVQYVYCVPVGGSPR